MKGPLTYGPVSQQPKIFYVDATAGNDANNGLSQANAWQTLAKVESSAIAGCIVKFKRGETWTVGGGTDVDAMLTIPESNITLTAYASGALPKLNGGGTFRRIVSIPSGVSNTKTKFLHLYNGGGGTGSLWANTGSGTHYIEDCDLDTHATDACASMGVGCAGVMRRCEIHGFADDGVTCHGLNGTGASVEIYNCNIYDGFDGLNHSVTNGGSITTLAESCYFWNNSSKDIGSLSTGNHTFNKCRFGKLGETPTSQTIQANVETSVTFNYCIIDGTAGSGNSVPSLSASAVPTTFNNCTFHGNPAISGKTGSINSTNSATITLRNCIFSQWFRTAYIATSGVVNANYCIFHQINTLNLTTNTNRIGTNTTDPLFTSPVVGGDFTLQSGSPAIGAGTTYSGQLATDFAGNTISDPPSLGALEYQA